MVIATITTFLVLVLLFFVRPNRPLQADSGYRQVMGTFARVVVIAKDSNTASECINAALDEIYQVDQLMSDYKKDSEISQVNTEAFNHPVKVSRPTFEVLQKSIEFSQLSEGAFDITIGPLVDLWRSAAEANSVPTEAELADARSKVGFEKLILDANEMSVRFAVDGMRLDLGGIAKGYAIDKAAEAAQRCGALGAMVDIGGDIRCFGTPPKDRNKWRIGLQDPNQAKDSFSTGQPLVILKLKNAAVATSGGYRRFALIEGKKHSHIINSRTGHSSDQLTSVTIICKNATDADALATAVSVLGAEKGLALIEKLPQTEAILIPADSSELIKTTGAENFTK